MPWLAAFPIICFPSDSYKCAAGIFAILSSVLFFRSFVLFLSFSSYTLPVLCIYIHFLSALGVVSVFCCFRFAHHGFLLALLPDPKIINRHPNDLCVFLVLWKKARQSWVHGWTDIFGAGFGWKLIILNNVILNKVPMIPIATFYVVFQILVQLYEIHVETI
jgi:hypothetical protein